MGRLFWKFFIAIWLAQLLGTMSVMFIVETVYRMEEAGRPRAAADQSANLLIDSAAATLRYGGTKALQIMVEDTARQSLMVVDENYREIFGRPVDPAALRSALDKNQQGEDTESVRQVVLPDGHRYLLFIQDAVQSSRQNDRAPLPPHGARLLPTEPLLAHLIASLVVAALLAHYLSRPIRSLSSAIRDMASGKLQVAVAAAVERRKDELADLLRDFDDMARRIATLVDGQRQLFHDVSHELRTPLARMQVAIGLARKQPEKIEKLLERIDGEIVRIDRLIGELLALSRLAVTEVGMTDEEFNIHALLAEIVDNARFEGKAKGQKIQYSGDREVSINGSPELMRRAIENVVRNAVEHTPDDCVISVESRMDAARARLRIVVSDTGPGVSGTEMVSGTKSGRSADGHGLGLSISKRIIDAHRGEIRIQNQAKGGLSVVIMLPVSPGPDAGGHP
ncbi:ATP-binding protein [Noviherbaspirillum sp.]|uniref:ATP-binding protein n=1 Tax=Noviherbaspirillum sp. TaxID=1926288 RepID=UPI002D404D76|nr:ATP-binding protein [Noviherbaspirillum sp.]HZW20834.1 ATP-binding protein [Noviherbaspirillum sp.]